MDIVSHVISGAVAGAALALLLLPRHPRVGSLPLVGALGAFVPDLDAASRAPGFDATIGRWLGLPAGRVIYAGSWWYSHHHFLHSLAAGLLGAAVAAWLARSADPRRDPGHLHVGAAFLLGFCAHLAGDLPTPGSVWSGIQAFWPLSVMVGGWGWTWWWNNYDLFLVLLAMLGGLGGLLGVRDRIPAAVTRAATVVLLLGGLVVLLYQASSRTTDYAYEGDTPRYAELEDASLREQRRILGDGPFSFLATVDRVLPVSF